MTTAEDALTAVRDASAALTLAIGHKDPRLAAVEPEVLALQRTLTRVQTLLAMHPDLAIGDELPAGAMPPEEEMQRITTNAALEMAIAIPSGPVTVRLQASPLHDGSYEDTLRHWINDRLLTAQPDGIGFSLDLSGFVAFLADTFIVEDEEPFAPTKMTPMTPARRKLFQAFGPREKEDT